MPTGYTAPFTPRGLASLVAPPPWHYCGWLLNVEFECDPARAAGFVPREVGVATGRGAVHFADWQATTDGSELLDPILSQYRETIVLVEVTRPDGTGANFCPLIYVDQDISMVRGLLQGWPKKHGSTWLTRSLPLDHPAAAPLRAGTRLAASLAVKDRRLIEARLVLTGKPAAPIGFAARPTWGTVGWPDLTRPGEPPARWSFTRRRAKSSPISVSGPSRGPARAGWASRSRAPPSDRAGRALRLGSRTERAARRVAM
jgi:hypothetical protein